MAEWESTYRGAGWESVTGRVGECRGQVRECRSMYSLALLACFTWQWAGATSQTSHSLRSTKAQS